ncbi:MAG: YbaN family protein [Terriglobia bacterium]
MAVKPLNPVSRALLLVVGTIMLGLGIVGIYLPVLPTTPFLLLAAACYVRSSERLFTWLVYHPRFGPPLNSFLKEKAVPLKVKVISLVIAWAILGGLALFVVESTLMKVLLLALGLLKTVFMLSIKTLRP